jgi:hypothetical protein
MLALSVTSTAFAGFRPVKHKKETKSSSFSQKSIIVNKSEAKTGDSIAIGNASATFICNSSEAERGRGYLTGSDSDSQVCVENKGNALSYSGEAYSQNVVDNDVCTDVRK